MRDLICDFNYFALGAKLICVSYNVNDVSTPSFNTLLSNAVNFITCPCYSIYIRLLKDVSNHTIHNTRIQVRYKGQYNDKTILINIVEQHACYKVALVRGGCASTKYEIVTAGSKVIRLGWFCRKKGGRVDVKYWIGQKRSDIRGAIICQTIVQHCRTSDLELTATCCIKLRLSLYFQIQT